MHYANETERDLSAPPQTKNPLLLKLIKGGSQTACAHACHVDTTTFSRLLNLRMSPFSSGNDEERYYTPAAARIADSYQVPVEVLFPASLYARLYPEEKSSSHLLVPLFEAARVPALDGNPEAQFTAEETHRRVREVLLTLKPVHRRVLEMRFGLDGNGERTLDQVAARFGCTGERIRQIEAKAFRILRRPARALRLQDTQDPLTQPAPPAGNSIGRTESVSDQIDIHANFVDYMLSLKHSHQLRAGGVHQS